MWWTNLIILSLLFQSLFIPSIDGNVHRRRRRRQSSGSLYGTNANLGASAPSGFNYPANTNFDGTRLNYPDARDRFGNPMIISSNGESPITSVDLNNQPRPQQQQLYGTNDQGVLNSYYSGNSFYSGTGGTNQLLRDPNGNLLPSGSAGSSFYSSNAQMAYPASQMLMNKDLYGGSSNANNNNNNQYGYSNNQLPNSNTYGGQMGGSNNNLPPNTNSYGGGSMGSNNNLVPNTNIYGTSYGGGSNALPNSNTYSGYQGAGGNDNSWSNTNTNNRYNPNSANSWYPARDGSYNNNNNNNNRYPNNNYNNNRYANSNPMNYNNSYRLTTPLCLLTLSIFASMIFRL